MRVKSRLTASFSPFKSHNVVEFFHFWVSGICTYVCAFHYRRVMLDHLYKISAQKSRTAVRFYHQVFGCRSNFVLLLQAADESVPAMPVHMAKKLMNKANPKDTGLMHGMFAAHLGMRVRLLEALDVNRGLVKDAEGEIAHVVVHPSD